MSIHISLHIHEWCQYMVASGRVDFPAESTVGTEQSEEASVLSDQHLQLLDKTYQAMFPEYKHLSDEYEIALRKARNARKLSTFPPRSEWKMSLFPPGSTEREMLVGCKPNITLLKKLVITDQHTHRQTTARHCSSYVQVTSYTSPTPTFGHIKSLFHHEFAGRVSQMAILNKYVDVYKHLESGLWWTLLKTVTEDIVVPMCHLSPPLVAIEGDNLWFLSPV